ncbi:hypothetical protein N9D23_15965, partial [Rubripirellula sp.]|nr:hypothetical protein [Rubripirellula sp.]
PMIPPIRERWTQQAGDNNDSQMVSLSVNLFTKSHSKSDHTKSAPRADRPPCSGVYGTPINTHEECVNNAARNTNPTTEDRLGARRVN